MLDLAIQHNAKRFVFASSNEIYGENRGDVELFDEIYLQIGQIAQKML